MELRRYLTIMRRGWWLAVPAFLAITAVTLVMVLPQPPTYESTTTSVVRPRSLDSSDSLRAFDTLTRGVQINATYATIARSDLIRDRARARLGPSAPNGGMTVNAEVVTGTNVLSISARGRDADAVRDFAAAIGTEAVAYVDGLRESYRLEPLDPATAARRVGPDKPLIIATGVILGALLGVGLALLREYLRSPAPSGPTAAPADQFSPLRREMRRARRNRETFSFGLGRFGAVDSPTNHNSQDPAAGGLKRAAQALQDSLRNDALLASLSGGTFAVMFPGLTATQAEDRLVQELAIASALDPAAAEATANPRTSIAVCEFRHDRFVGDATAAHIAHLLTRTPRPSSSPQPAPAPDMTTPPTPHQPPPATRTSTGDYQDQEGTRHGG